MDKNISNIFLVRMSNPGFTEIALARGLAVIGWSKLPELLECNTVSSRRDDIKNILRNSDHDYYDYGYQSEHAIGNIAGSIHRFLYDISSEDLIILPVDKGFHLGTVQPGQSRATYNKDFLDRDACFQWKVDWKEDENGNVAYYKRRILSGELVSFFKSQHTCLKLDDKRVKSFKQSIQNKIRSSLSRYISSNQDVLEGVLHGLQKELDNGRLEELIQQILEKEGASVSRYQCGEKGKSGDIDLKAYFSIYCNGLTPYDICFAYQIKHHQGESDKEAIIQLIKRFQDVNEEKYDAGIAITTGTFSATAQKLCSEYNDTELGGKCPISMINGEDLAKWVLQSGLYELD